MIILKIVPRHVPGALSSTVPKIPDKFPDSYEKCPRYFPRADLGTVLRVSARALLPPDYLSFRDESNTALDLPLEVLDPALRAIDLGRVARHQSPSAHPCQTPELGHLRGMGKSLAVSKHGMVWYGMVWHGMTASQPCQNMVGHHIVWHGIIWYGMVRCGMVWYR